MSLSLFDVKKEIYSSDFLAFWEKYPNKKAKMAAWKAWQKNGIKKVPLETILKAIELQKNTDQWKKDGGQFIPHPATWLNQHRWEDEIDGTPLEKMVSVHRPYDSKVVDISESEYNRNKSIYRLAE